MTLGGTPDTIAESLRLDGVKGIKGDPYYCPIINGIYKNCGIKSSGLRAAFFYYPSGYKNMGPYGYMWVGSRTCFKLTWGDSQTIDPIAPTLIGEFVEKFDNGAYPFLECNETKDNLKNAALAKLSPDEKRLLGIYA